MSRRASVTAYGRTVEVEEPVSGPIPLIPFNRSQWKEDYDSLAGSSPSNSLPPQEHAQQNQTRDRNFTNHFRTLPADATDLQKRVYSFIKELTSTETAILTEENLYQRLRHGKTINNPHPLEYQLRDEFKEGPAEPSHSLSLLRALQAAYPLADETLKVSYNNLINFKPSLDRRRDQVLLTAFFAERLMDDLLSSEEIELFNQIDVFYQALINKEFELDYERLFENFELFNKYRGATATLTKIQYQHYDHYQKFLDEIQNQNAVLELNDNELNILSTNPSKEGLMKVISKPQLRTLLTRFYPSRLEPGSIETLADNLLTNPTGLSHQQAEVEKVLHQAPELLAHHTSLAQKAEGLRCSCKIAQILNSSSSTVNAEATSMQISQYLDLSNSDARISLNLSGLRFNQLPYLTSDASLHYIYSHVCFNNAVMSSSAIINVILGDGNIKSINWKASALADSQREYEALQDLVQAARQLCTRINQRHAPSGIQQLFARIIKPEKNIHDILSEAQQLFTYRKAGGIRGSCSRFWCELFHYQIRKRAPATNAFYESWAENLSQLTNKTQTAAVAP